MMYPLAGLRVVDLARVLAGPWIGQTLADLGAKVVKVESPDGDDTRSWGPAYVDKGSDHSAAYFHSANRGKKGIIADFKNPDDLARVKRLIQNADVVIENYKVGGLQKFGLDYASLSPTNPRLIYCSVTGFGQDGPHAHRAGYDFMIQGMTGLMDITGEADGMPQKVGVAFADVFTGLYGVIGIQAALLQRQHTGVGQHIDMALFDCLLAAQANQNMNYLVTGTSPKRMGNAHPSIVPYQVFPVSDGHIIIAIGNNRQFHNFAQVVGCDHWITDPRYADNPARLTHRADLIAEITTALADWTRDDMLNRLAQVGVPAGPINSVGDAINDPQVAHRGLRISPQGIPGIRAPFMFSDSTLQLDRAAPGLGEHDDESDDGLWG